MRKLGLSLAVCALLLGSLVTMVPGSVQAPIASWSHDSSPATTVFSDVAGSVSVMGGNFGGNVEIKIVGSAGHIRLEVSNTTIKGFLHVLVKDNTEVLSIDVKVLDNRVRKDILVDVSNNQFNRNAGKDLKVKVHRNMAGDDITVLVNNNWVLQDLDVEILENRADGRFQIEINNNTVNNYTATISKNKACKDFKALLKDNAIDRAMTVSISTNVATTFVLLSVSKNHYPPPYPQLFTSMSVDVTDNHAVFRDFTLFIDENHLADEVFALLKVVVEDNGAGESLIVSFTGNLALKGKIDAEFRRNASYKTTTIFSSNNKAAMLTITIADNFARNGTPNVGPQYTSASNNLQKDAQTEGGDTDMDGLSERYEKMIGMDPSKADSDGDGLYDGWVDTDSSRMWNTGDGFGEIGDPRNAAGQVNGVNIGRGSIATLFDKKEANPNPLCLEMYLEVDRMGGAELPSSAVNRVVDAFAEHMIRLHVDDGWKTGVAGPAGGTGGESSLPRITPLWMLRAPGASDDFYDLKATHFDANRRGVFHYVIVGHRIQFRDGSGNINTNATGIAAWSGSNIDGDDFFLADEAIRARVGALNRTPNVGRSGVLMHELGHSLGLNPPGFVPGPFAGIDNTSTDRLSPTFNAALFTNYRSVMNYRYTTDGLVDYSDGKNGRDALGNPDHDDWSAINLGRIQRWNVYEG